MITYNDIYEAARKERYSDQLQPLSKVFLQDVADYLFDKKKVAAKEEDGFSDMILKTKKQLENAITLFRELILRRRKKILNLVLIASETGISKQDFENMLQTEKNLFEELIRCVDLSDKVLDEILNGKKEEKNNSLIVIKENVNELVGLDGEKMGPYEKGQLVNLSKKVAEILVSDNKAEFVE